MSRKDFYNDGVNQEIELKSHYFKWQDALAKAEQEGEEFDPRSNFTLCAYPWILDTASKAEILKVENSV